jgi:hypothetical protein
MYNRVTHRGAPVEVTTQSALTSVSRGISGPPPEAWSKATPGASTRSKKLFRIAGALNHHCGKTKTSFSASLSRAT